MSKREIDRQNSVAVSDDQRKESGLGPQEGDWYAFVTPGPIYFGQIIAVTPTDYLLRDASWIAETGRLNEFVKKPTVATEAEFVGDMFVPRGAVMGGYRCAPGKVDTR